MSAARACTVTPPALQLARISTISTRSRRDLDAISTEVRSRCDLDLDGGQACTGEAGACESRGCGGGRVGWRCERCGCRCAVECSLSIVREPYERTLPWSQDLRLSDQCCAGAAANLGVRKLYRSIQGWWGHR
eukprot:scaffold75584_cov54-Phaeocystis_antarctica.AAC.1